MAVAGASRLWSAAIVKKGLPAALAARVTKVEKVLDAYEGDLTEDGLHGMISNGSRRGDNLPPGLTSPHGNVKFWIKDGVLTKFQYRLAGSMTFNATEVKIDRETTVEIHDIGTAKVEVPEEVQRKLLH